MLEADKVFAGSIPENYDRYMVPLIFAPFATDLARRAAALMPVDILEVAAGTGAVTRELTSRLLPAASYVVTDLNQPMLDFAASQQAPDHRIKWQQADAQLLPLQALSLILSSVSSAQCSSVIGRRPIVRQSGY